MVRQLITCLIFVLILQGVAQASADVSVESQTQHCAGHQMSGQDCACCTDEMTMSGGCASLCSVSIVVGAASFDDPRVLDDEPHWLIKHAPPGPDYTPLKPPPNS